jgi:hypothetical protein
MLSSNVCSAAVKTCATHHSISNRNSNSVLLQCFVLLPLSVCDVG